VSRVGLFSLLAVTRSAWAADESGELPEGPEGKVLGRVTGFHSVRHKKFGLEARLLEADGSPSVGENPVALYLVVTNNGTSDLVERVWHMPRRGCSCSQNVSHCLRRRRGGRCRSGQFRGTGPGSTRKTLRLCFLSPEAKLQTTLKIT
jgi:hypothetical protein